MRTLSNFCDLSDYYKNHCIRVTGVTNLTRSNFTAKQVMSVTDHKSIQSLSIYQKFREDNKLSMGISWTYSLMHPNEVKHPQDIIKQECKTLENKRNIPALANPNAPALLLQNVQQPAIEAPPQQIVQNHALDPANNNILPLEGALVPYQPPAKLNDQTDADQ